MFGQRWTIFNNPRQYEKAFQNYLLAFGKTVSQEKTIASLVTMHRLAVVGNTTATFFQGTASLGVNTNLNSFVRPEGEHFLIERIRIYTGAAASLQATDWVPGITTADILNGLLTVTNNGIVALNKIPLTQFNQTTTNEMYAGYFILEEPILWGGQTDLNVVCTWPVALATANQNMQVELVGMGLVS